MSTTRDLLIEIGTEELPPKSLLTLIEAFAAAVAAGLQQAQLAFASIEHFATPRRLALRIHQLVEQQPEQHIQRTGPAVAQCFDAQGQPTKAALGFAASCGVPLDQLAHADSPKGKVLFFSSVRKGQATSALLAEIINAALRTLPIAKRMRWGANEIEFVRPVHWVVLLFGHSIVPAEILGLPAGQVTYGHRFHAPGALTLSHPDQYVSLLQTRGHVQVDINTRREIIRHGVQATATAVGGVAVIEPELLDEVTALVEWPVAIAGQFEARFLSLPAEVLIATMQDHQRYFPVRNTTGALLPWFIAVANIDSRDSSRVRAGNERVIRPRLSDATFFWELDLKQPLAARRAALKEVKFQEQLGSMEDKVQRIEKLTQHIAPMLGCNAPHAQRAAMLSKCDLLTAMVGEFPELQGVMGKYYAQHDGEDAVVCQALAEHYWPKFAGDALPSNTVGMTVALADKLDTIVGIFAIGQRPTGTRDPFGLRRQALGILRICIEKQLNIDLAQLIAAASALFTINKNTALYTEVYDYIMERLRAYYTEQPHELAEQNFSTDLFTAVLVTRPHSPLDFVSRMQALKLFLQLPAATSLTAANKRIANILKKTTTVTGSTTIDASLLQEPAERDLFTQLTAVITATRPLLAKKDYHAVLNQLADLRVTVDQFFDAVMVMAEAPPLRANRLALLAQLRALFLEVADLSYLPQ